MSSVPESETELKNYLSQGIREYYCRNYDTSVDFLEKAVKFATSKFGETSSVCIDPYFYYGLALLALSRSGGDDVLSSAFPEGEVSEQDQSCEVSDDEEADSSKGEVEDELNSHLQLSWEVFAVCLKILESDKLLEESARLRKQSQVHLNLAQINIESGNNEEALADINAALEIRGRTESGCSVREVAECHYHMGLLNAENNHFEEAIGGFSRAIECMKAVCADCEETREEIDRIVEDLRIKISDCEEGKTGSTSTRKVVMEPAGFDKDALPEYFNDITHLLHKGAPQGESCAKSDVAQEGSCAEVCPQSNGALLDICTEESAHSNVALEGCCAEPLDEICAEASAQLDVPQDRSCAEVSAQSNGAEKEICAEASAHSDVPRDGSCAELSAQSNGAEKEIYAQASAQSDVAQDGSCAEASTPSNGALKEICAEESVQSSALEVDPLKRGCVGEGTEAKRVVTDDIGL